MFKRTHIHLATQAQMRSQWLGEGRFVDGFNVGSLFHLRKTASRFAGVVIVAMIHALIIVWPKQLAVLCNTPEGQHTWVGQSHSHFSCFCPKKWSFQWTSMYQKTYHSGLIVVLYGNFYGNFYDNLPLFVEEVVVLMNQLTHRPICRNRLANHLHILQDIGGISC